MTQRDEGPRMKIEVKQKHINEGQASCGLSCAVALAVRDKFKTNDVHVSFDLTHENLKNCVADDGILQINVGSNKNMETYIPVYGQQLQVEEFISDFDCGNEVKPFKFDIQKA
tara:strand:+ start:216 stop:554 length:339 start_codon:yes stop_codon:yes gene_type:complete